METVLFTGFPSSLKMHTLKTGVAGDKVMLTRGLQLLGLAYNHI